jgi:hypothetical protein
VAETDCQPNDEGDEDNEGNENEDANSSWETTPSRSWRDLIGGGGCLCWSLTNFFVGGWRRQWTCLAAQFATEVRMSSIDSGSEEEGIRFAPDVALAGGFGRRFPFWELVCCHWCRL